MNKIFTGFLSGIGILITLTLSSQSYARAKVYTFSRAPRLEIQVDPQNPAAAPLLDRCLYARQEMQNHPLSVWDREKFLASLNVTEEQLAAVKPIFHLAYTAASDVAFQSISDKDVEAVIQTFQMKPDDWLKVTGAKLLPMVLRLWRLDPSYYAPEKDSQYDWAELFAKLESQIPREAISLEWFVPVRFSGQAQVNEDLVTATQSMLDLHSEDFLENVRKLMQLSPQLDSDRQTELAEIIKEQIANVYVKSKKERPFDPMFLPNGWRLIEYYLNHASSIESRANFLQMVLAQTEHELAGDDSDSLLEFTEWLVQVAEPVLQSNLQFSRSLKSNLLNVPKFDIVPDLLARLQIYEPLRHILKADPHDEQNLYDSYIEAWSEAPTVWTRAITPRILKTYLSRDPAVTVDRVWTWIHTLMDYSPVSNKDNVVYSKTLSILLGYWSAHQTDESKRRDLIGLMRIYMGSSWFGELPEFQTTFLEVVLHSFSADRDGADFEKLFAAAQVKLHDGPENLIKLLANLSVFFQGLKPVAGDHPKRLDLYNYAYSENATEALRRAMREIDGLVPMSSSREGRLAELQNKMGFVSSQLIMNVKQTLPVEQYRVFLGEVAMSGPTWHNAKGFTATMRDRHKLGAATNQLYETLLNELTHVPNLQLKISNVYDCGRLLAGAPAGTVSRQK